VTLKEAIEMAKKVFPNSTIIECNDREIDMGLLDNLKNAGFKPEANTDGEFKPLVGSYECNITVLRPEVDKKNNNAKFYQLCLKPVVALEGDAFGDKFEFKKRYYVDGDKATENLQKLINDLFTAGIELDLSSDAAFEADFPKAIGAKAFVRSWGWKPEGKDQPTQMFVIQKEKVAAKKKNENSLTF